jgi:hypothetical protein
MSMSVSGLDLRALIPLALWQAPLVGVWLSGLILALVRWKRHPRVSALVLIAMVVLLGEAVFGTVAMVMVASVPGNSGARWNWTALMIVRMGLQVVGFALVLAATFSDRQQKWHYAPPPVFPPGEAYPPHHGYRDSPPDAIRE